MMRLLLSWKRTAFAYCALATVLTLVLAAVSASSGSYYFPLAIFVACALFFSFLRYWQILWRFGKKTWTFKRLVQNSTVILYEPGLEGVVDVSEYRNLCDASCDDMRGFFKVGTTRPLIVYLFARRIEIQQIFGTGLGGLALAGGDAVAVPADGTETELQETTRHEIAHVFAHYWNHRSIPLNEEGLAMYLQRTVSGRLVDFEALLFVLEDSYISLGWLNSPEYFVSGRRRACYAISGSFTGFLIHRFGWHRYSYFYRAARVKQYATVFERVFKITLAVAEREWRSELLSRRGEFEPSVSLALDERRLEVQFQNWQFYQCLQTFQRLSESGDPRVDLVWTAAAANLHLGRYDDALALMKRVLTHKGLSSLADSVEAWIQLGNLYDLLNERNDACHAYSRALAEPESWHPRLGSSHIRATRHLAEPYREAVRPPGQQ